MDKFFPGYELAVEVDQGFQRTDLGFERSNDQIEQDKGVVFIRLPITLEFEVVRKSQGSAQTATFRLFNLARTTRDAIQKDIYEMTTLRRIKFSAGYASNTAEGRALPVVFRGSIMRAQSWREGTTWVTEIDAYDGYGMVNSRTVTVTMSPGISTKQVLEKLVKLVPTASEIPVIGGFPVTNKRGEVLVGNAWELIQKKSDNLALIDNGQIKILNFNEVTVSELAVITSDTGLLGSPKRTDSSLEFDMIFEPRLTLMQKVQLRSQTNRQYNRDWKVLGVTHRGVISTSVSGERRTSVTLWFTPEDFKVVQVGKQYQNLINP